MKMTTSTSYTKEDHRNKKHILYSIYLVLFINSMSSGLILPILPELFLSPRNGFTVEHMILSKELLYSLAIALFPLLSIFGMSTLGIIADKYDKYTVISYALCASILNYMLSIISILIHNVWLFLLSRVLNGFLSGTYAVGMAIISQLSDTEEERISNFKLPAIAPALGLILSACLSLFIDKITIINPLIFPFLIVCMLGIINLLLLYTFKATVLSKEKAYAANHNAHIASSTHSMDHNNSLSVIILKSTLHLFSYIFISKTTMTLALSYLLLQCACNLYTQSLLLHLSVEHHYSPGMISVFFTAMFLAMTISMYILSKLIGKYINFIKQIEAGLMFTSLLLLVTIFTHANLKAQHSINTIWIVTLIFYILIPFATLGFTNLFATHAGKQEQGTCMGAIGQLSSISILIPALVLGQNNINHDMATLVAGICLGLSYIILKYQARGNTLSTRSQR